MIVPVQWNEQGVLVFLRKCLAVLLVDIKQPAGGYLPKAIVRIRRTHLSKHSTDDSTFQGPGGRDTGVSRVTNLHEQAHFRRDTPDEFGEYEQKPFRNSLSRKGLGSWGTRI